MDTLAEMLCGDVAFHTMLEWLFGWSGRTRNAIVDPGLAQAIPEASNPVVEWTPHALAPALQALVPQWYGDGVCLPEAGVPEERAPPSLPTEFLSRLGRILEGRFEIGSAGMHVLRILGRKDVTTRQISEAVSTDPVLATKVLKTVNSAAFGLHQPVTSVGRAVVLLGHNTVKAIALHQTFGAKALGQDAAVLRGLWIHGAVVSACAQMLARSSSACDSSDAATVGLLSSLGRILLKESERERLTKETGLPHRVLEALAASRFAHATGLPVGIAEGLEYAFHSGHFGMKAVPVAAQGMSSVVCVASWISSLCGFGDGENPVPPDAQALELVGVEAGQKLDPVIAIEMEKARDLIEGLLG